MELKLNSMGGEGSLPLFAGGGVELSSSFGARVGARGSRGGELYEELEPEWELESTSTSAGCLVGEAFIPARRGDWRHATSTLVTLVVVLFTLLAAGT